MKYKEFGIFQGEFMLWRCKSRLYCGQECSSHCEIVADFVPTCCVRGSGFQEWEKDNIRNQYMDKIDVEKRLEEAKTTLRNLEGTKIPIQISISRQSLITYCKETIELCEQILKKGFDEENT